MAKGNRDLELLIKMMGQTTNDNDHIALASIRKANEQVLKLAGTWDELLRGHFTIAADPFEGLNIPGFSGNGASAPPPMPSTFRRGVSPTPPPQPAPPQPPPRPQAPPNPMGASSSSSFQSRKYNMHRAVCHKCGSWCAANQGYLDGRDAITNQWKVICIDDMGCAQRAAKPKPKRATSAAKSTDNLTNILGS